MPPTTIIIFQGDNSKYKFGTWPYGKKQPLLLLLFFSSCGGMSELAILRHMDRAMVGFGGTMPPKFFFKNIIKYIDTNFSNFILENYTFVPLKISLILLRVLL